MSQFAEHKKYIFRNKWEKVLISEFDIFDILMNSKVFAVKCYFYDSTN